MRTTRLATALLLALSAACADPGDDEPAPVVDWPTLECDPIAPEYCGHPFPSNVFTVADDTTPTGRRIELSAAMMPVNGTGVAAEPAPWARGDGFSPAGTIMVHLPGATATGLPSMVEIERSLADDSPTVLLDAESGERIAHFAELDASAADPSRAVLFVHPAARLASATRYLVALRGVVDDAGDPLEASPAFAALRDRAALTDEPSVEERRPLYVDIFARLGDAGVARDDLQLAWDFTTASDENLVGWLVHMRDEAFALAGPDGPTYTITAAQEDFDPRIAYRLEGTFDAPLFLDSTERDAKMVVGADGLPEANGTAPFEFEVLIPQAALTQPAALLQYGHGLLGTHREIEREEFIQIADDYGYVIFATDWIGLTEPDQPFIAVNLENGRVQDYDHMFARLQQATVNALLLGRTMSTRFAADPTYGAFVQSDQRYYYGISLGGIMGALYMSVSQDVTRGVLEVMGSPFSLLLGRSTNFDLFFTIAQGAYEDPRDIQLIMAMVQMLWDRVEPDGFVTHLNAQPLANTPAHDVLMRAAVGDHSVPTIGAHTLARSLAAPHIDSGVREVYGLEPVADAFMGTAYIEYDFGLPPEPTCAVPERKCDNPHGKIRVLTEAHQQLDHFLRTGEARNFCPNGVCSWPEMSGCAPDEDLTDPCAP